MAAAKSSRRFYQNGRVTTELGGSVTRSIFRHQGSLLAQCTSGAEESRSIMAVNNSNTVMSELRDSGKAQFAYTPYGRRTVQGESNNPLSFNGELLDTPTGFYLLGSYRLFSTTFYGFYSPDDQSPFGKGGLNSKAYCAGDPINNVDPTGHFFINRLFHFMPKVLRRNPLLIAAAVTGLASAATEAAALTVKDSKTADTLFAATMALAATSLSLSVASIFSGRRSTGSRTVRPDGATIDLPPAPSPPNTPGGDRSSGDGQWSNVYRFPPPFIPRATTARDGIPPAMAVHHVRTGKPS